MNVFSKSTFKKGLECPNKLYYLNDKTYANQKQKDSFLNYLAEGGFQVEELARLHYPNGKCIEAESYEYELAVNQTKTALKEENIVLFDAAFLHDGYYSRCDIIEKKGNVIRLIEVKAKSFDSTNDYLFMGRRGKLTSEWKPYLFDLAFQKKVIQLAFPALEVQAFFMMADKNKQAGIDGLNQFFRVTEGGKSRKNIQKYVTSLEDVGNSVLTEINMDEVIHRILSDQFDCYGDMKFSVVLPYLKEKYLQRIFSNVEIDVKACKKCEFKASIEEKENGLKSGFEHCFKMKKNWSDADFRRPNIMEIWNFRTDTLVKQNRLFLDEVQETDLNITIEADRISSSERRWIQVEKSRSGDNSVHVEKDGLKAEMGKWEFPLHFIDFETSTVALPFTKGRKPYEQVAFQFSHHIYHADGRIEHATEFISHTPGEFPNFVFARALKEALSEDKGSIFCYASHENTILNAIMNQLNESEVTDKEELISFLKTIAKPTSETIDTWHAEREMIDLKNVIQNYYYNPFTKGSNSIKAVLPASLQSSAFLQAKYVQPLHRIQVSSKNFEENHCWLSIENGKIKNPYKMLPPLFADWQEEEKEGNVMGNEENIADGGAALAAYGKLQYQDMSERERTAIVSGLLKYCELDTLAMVMIYEHLKEMTIG